MPRTTHPAPKSGHSRAHVREMRDRYAAKRWRRAKNGSHDRGLVNTAEWIEVGRWMRRDPDGDRAPVFTHPETVRQDPGSYRYIHPFSMPMNKFTRSWETYCSCLGCSGRLFDPVPRARNRHEWQREWIEEAAMGAGDDCPLAQRHSTRRLLREIAGGW